MNMRALHRAYTNITISFQIILLLSVPPLSTSSISVLPCSPELCSSGKLPCPHQRFGFEKCMNVYIDTSLNFICSILRAFEEKIGKSWENTKRVLGENYEISNVKIHYL